MVPVHVSQDNGAVAALRSLFTDLFRCCVTTNLYLSGDAGSVGFVEHHDNHDVFAIQLHGVSGGRTRTSGNCSLLTAHGRRCHARLLASHRRRSTFPKFWRILPRYLPVLGGRSHVCVCWSPRVGSSAQSPWMPLCYCGAGTSGRRFLGSDGPGWWRGHAKRGLRRRAMGPSDTFLHSWTTRSAPWAWVHRGTPSRFVGVGWSAHMVRACGMGWLVGEGLTWTGQQSLTPTTQQPNNPRMPCPPCPGSRKRRSAARRR